MLHLHILWYCSTGKKNMLVTPGSIAPVSHATSKRLKTLRLTDYIENGVELRIRGRLAMLLPLLYNECHASVPVCFLKNVPKKLKIFLSNLVQEHHAYSVHLIFVLAS
jgi:hypothetical protein